MRQSHKWATGMLILACLPSRPAGATDLIGAFRAAVEQDDRAPDHVAQHLNSVLRETRDGDLRRQLAGLGVGQTRARITAIMAQGIDQALDAERGRAEPWSVTTSYIAGDEAREGGTMTISARVERTLRDGSKRVRVVADTPEGKITRLVSARRWHQSSSTVTDIATQITARGRRTGTRTYTLLIAHTGGRAAIPRVTLHIQGNYSGGHYRLGERIPGKREVRGRLR